MPDAALEAYLLGTTDFDALLAAQRRLVYEVSGDRSRGVLLLTEHPPLVSVGRHGSWAHILLGNDDLAARGWPVRWVNRGGGCLLHARGQLAVYPILALDALGLTLGGYLDELHRLIAGVARSLDVPAEWTPGRAGVRVGGRLVAPVGVAVRDWVSSFGFAVNVHADLEPFRDVRWGAADEPPMTSLERERRTPLRATAVRQRVVETFADRFGFGRLSLFHHHPALPARTTADAVATGTR